MQAWAEDQGVDKAGGFITLMGDPTATLTSKLGVELTAAGPMGKGLISRCKRVAIFVVDGVIKLYRISENEGGADDPAGDDYPEATLAPAMLEAITQLGKDEL
mmetsp:Transcript_1506/g.4814  ORF Transcript_1506/g.4814 Transcript_1506/m.4814 type:complete len:103 (-) Transcript_1506:970-1278(-)